MATEGNVPEQPPVVSPEDDASGPYVRPGTAVGEAPRPQRHLSARVRQIIHAVRDNDRAAVEEAVVRLSRSRRWLAPLALAVGALAMLFDGVKLLFTNWRLSLVQVLPAMWIWAAMFDLKAHVLHGKSFHVLTGPVVIPIVLAVAVITAASFFLNAVFAFAISSEGPPAIRPGFAQARSHLAVVLGWGAAVGICLGLATVVFVRWGVLWFGLSLSIVVAVMMVCYVAVPARVVGVKTTSSKRDKLTAFRGGRGDRSGRLHTALRPWPGRAAHGRVAHALHRGLCRARHRLDVAGRCHRRGQGDQDECQARLREPAGRGR